MTPAEALEYLDFVSGRMYVYRVLAGCRELQRKQRAQGASLEAYRAGGGDPLGAHVRERRESGNFISHPRRA